MKVFLSTICQATAINRDADQNIERIVGTAERASRDSSNGLNTVGQPPLAGFRQTGRGHCINTNTVNTTEGGRDYVITD